MSSREQVDAQPIPLDGWLADRATLPRLYTWLSRGEWSGMVVVRSGDVERRIYFADGRISTAGSDDPADSLANHLIRAGALSEEDRSRAAGQARTTDRGWSFGKQLVKMGMLDDQSLTRTERRRVLAIAQATLALQSGQYACEAGTVAGDAMPNQALEVPRVVAEGVLSAWDASAALDALGGPDAILDMIPERLSDYEATGAAEEYDLTLMRCNGKRSVREVVAMSPLPEGAALRFLAAARLAQCLTSVPGDPRARASYDPEATVPPDEAAAPAFSVEDTVGEAADLAELEDTGGASRAAESAAPAAPSAPAEQPAPAASTGPALTPAAARALRGTTTGETKKAVAEAPAKRRGVRRGIVVGLTVLLLAAAGYVAWRGWVEIQATSAATP